MVEVTELPPQPNLPKLTARHVIKTLGEHRVAFLAANNLTWCKMDDDEYVLRDDRIADILLMVACTKGMHYQHIKDFGWKIRRLAKDRPVDLPLTAAIDLVAKALGYNHATLANVCRDEDSFVENLWGHGVIITEQMFSGEGKVKGNKRAYERVYANRHRNLAEAKVRNKLRASADEPGRRDIKDLKLQEIARQRAKPIEFR